MQSTGICVNIWTPNQVEWPRPIRSELHVESLKRPKHAVHNEWLGTLLTTRIKKNIYSIQHPQLSCSLYLVKNVVARCRIPSYKKHTVCMVIYHTNFVGICYGG